MGVGVCVSALYVGMHVTGAQLKEQGAIDFNVQGQELEEELEEEVQVRRMCPCACPRSFGGSGPGLPFQPIA